ncbi:DUF5659 domain-containing protein [Heyndrickxia ginsengihumi]|uniref:DUF5659 domain-containing protein n=1 Tax=Heyndrickxia ginsengihumi TaxID=363870 RepID=UPI0018CC33E9|nr:DUF5659 domain-containing protein [Heyndrickxia ginsengihumi]
MNNYFFCYTKRVSDFLKQNGFKPITVAQDPKTKKIFSLYAINEQLQRALDEYKK